MTDTEHTPPTTPTAKRPSFAQAARSLLREHFPDGEATTPAELEDLGWAMYEIAGIIANRSPVKYRVWLAAMLTDLAGGGIDQRQPHPSRRQDWSYTDDEIPAYVEDLGKQVVTAADELERAAKEIQQAAGGGHANEIRELFVGAVEAFGTLDDVSHWLRVMAGEWTETPAGQEPTWLKAHHTLQALADQACWWAREVFGEVSTQHAIAQRHRAAALMRYADELEWRGTTPEDRAEMRELSRMAREMRAARQVQP